MFNLFNEEVSLISCIFGCILLSIFLLIEEKKQKALYILINDKFWIVNTIIIILFYLFIHFSPSLKKLDSEKREKLKDAAQKAIIAFIIAVFASLDLTIVPFWFVFSFAYFTDLV